MHVRTLLSSSRLAQGSRQSCEKAFFESVSDQTWSPLRKTTPPSNPPTKGPTMHGSPPPPHEYATATSPTPPHRISPRPQPGPRP